MGKIPLSFDCPNSIANLTKKRNAKREFFKVLRIFWERENFPDFAENFVEKPLDKISNIW